MINRDAMTTLKTLADEFPVVIVTGPRQSGKSTIVKTVFPHKPYLSFDELDRLELAKNDPRGFLSNYPDGAIIDEAQKFPELLSYIKSRVDTTKKTGEFIITGSQQLTLLSQVSESLAGRAGIVQLLPFSIHELSASHKLPNSLDKTLFNGLYPPLYDRTITSGHWYSGYVATYIERDVRAVLNIKDLGIFQKFLRMCAARCGQLLNISNLANDCGISTHTANSWISVLEASYIIFRFQPYFINFGKRLVKSPKLYFYDTGLAAWLLNIQDEQHLSIHPTRGALFENLVIAELLKTRFNQGLASNLYFWRDNLGDEIDIIIDNGQHMIAVEAKSSQTITTEHLKTLNKWEKITGKKNQSYLIYTGKESHTHDTIRILPWTSIPVTLSE